MTLFPKCARRPRAGSGNDAATTSPHILSRCERISAHECEYRTRTGRSIRPGAPYDQVVTFLPIRASSCASLTGTERR